MRYKGKHLNERVEARRRKRNWKRITGLLSVVVVLTTLAILTLPGTTLSTVNYGLNPYDIGPDELDVYYYVYIDDAWEQVGHTAHGWVAENQVYRDPHYDGKPSRDFITADMVEYIFGPFGYDVDGYLAAGYDPAIKVAYQRVDANGNRMPNVWSDTYADVIQTGVPEVGDNGLTRIIPLTGHADRKYNLYFMPSNDKNWNYGSDGTKYEELLPAAENAFYSITVSDPKHIVYPVGTEPRFVAAKGGSGSIVIQPAPGGWQDFGNATVVNYEDGTIRVHYDNITSPIRVSPNTVYDDDKSLLINNSVEKPDDLLTIDGKKEGFQFKLFDYSYKINEYLHTFGLTGSTPTSTDTHYFFFRNNENTPWDSTYIWNKYDKDGYNYFIKDGTYYPNHATVKLNLKDGFPALDLTHHGDPDLALSDYEQTIDGTSLGMLFGQTETPHVKQYHCLNTPLVEENGFYKYTSITNAATFNTVTNQWHIRNYPERGQTTATSYPSYNDFLPFNNTLSTTNLTTPSGNIYQFPVSEVDYWFGMYMHVSFYQGTDGQANGQDMVFRFSGDDDVWVFIDEMLVLDIGGTHGAVTGTINYHTGFVESYYDFHGENAKNNILQNGGKNAAGQAEDRYYSTTIYECYKAALRERGMTEAQIAAELAEIFIRVEGQTVTDARGFTYDVYRFRNYSAHSLDMFYMERGSAASNCTISLNLPTLPSESLTVGKDLDLTGLDAEQAAFAKDNLSYRFRVVTDNGDPLFAGWTVDILDEALQDTGEDLVIGADGWFRLKSGQRVQFPEMAQHCSNAEADTYYVEEAIPQIYTDQYHGVVYRDSGTSGLVTVEGQPGADDMIVYKTNPLTPSKTYKVIYTNRVNVDKMPYLQVGKGVLEGSVYDGVPEFLFQILMDGVPIPEGTEFESIRGGPSVRADKNGCIAIRPGQLLQMKYPVIAGTTYTVKEILPSGSSWLLDHYTTSPLVGSGPEIYTVAAQVSGQIPMEGARVIAHNKTFSFSASVPLQKLWQGVNADAQIDRWAEISAWQVADKNGTALPAGTVQTPLGIHPVAIPSTGASPGTDTLVIGYAAGTPNGSYFYQITETGYTAGSGELVIPDESVYVAEIVVENNTARLAGLYKDGEAVDTAVFVNTLGVPELPATGGTGTIPYTISGLALIAMAAVGYILLARTGRKEEQ